jgi:iron complex transport system ATP-binding protein
VRSIAKLISVVLTYEGTFGGITAREMVSMGRSPYTNFLGKLTPADRAIVDRAMEKTATGHLAKQKMAELSDGERQKIMIAKSLAQQTGIILLDEPTAFLDFPGKIETLQLLRQMAHRENKTILLSTHDLHLALQFADRIWLLGSNKPLIAGVPEDLILQDKFAEFFNRNHTAFDKFSGEFIFRRQSKAMIGVEGNGLRSQWLKKALQRKGFRVDENKTADIQITTGNNRFVLQLKSSTKEFEHISGLLDELNKYNIT